MANKKFMDSEKARDSKKKPEEPAGPASMKSLNRRRLPTNKDAELEQQQQLMQSLSSDRLRSSKQKPDNMASAEPSPNQRPIMQKLSDRLMQNPVGATAQQSSSKEVHTHSSKAAGAKVQLSSAQVGRNEGDKLNKIDSPNDDIDEDKDFEDCDKDG